MQDNRVDNVGISDSQIERHTSGRRHGVAPDAAPVEIGAELVEVEEDDDGEHGGDAGAEGVASEGEGVVGVVGEEVPEEVALGVENPGGGAEEAVVDVAAMEAALAEAVVEEEGVVGLPGEVEAAEGEDDVGVGVVEVEEVGGDAAAGVGVGAAADDAAGVEGVAGVVVVVGHDEAAEARDGGEVVGGGEAPGGAVAVAGVEAPLPRPPRASQAVDAFQQREPAGERHASALEAEPCSARFEITTPQSSFSTEIAGVRGAPPLLPPAPRIGVGTEPNRIETWIRRLFVGLVFPASKKKREFDLVW